MTSKLNILLIALDNTDLSDTLTSISKQTFTNWELYIITFEKINNISNIIKDKYQIIKINEKTSIFNFLLSFSSSLSGDFIALIANCDINDPKRFEKQISFMNSNNLNICSCLEASMNNNIYEKEALIESNKFIDSDNINSVISASYLPLDLYTFVLRKSFLIDILPYCTHSIFDSEIDLILYFLRFEKISKVPEILYYVQKSRLPYKECLNYCESPLTTNKLAIFNRNKILDNQSYFKEIITSKKKLSTYCIEYDSTIVTILNSVNIGGTESYVINLANRLKKEKIQLCILTNECFNKELFVFYDIPLYIFDLKNIYKFKNTLSIIPNIKLIQIHMDKDLYLCPMIKSILNVPIIFTIHGIYYSEKIIQSYSNYLDEIIFVSEYSKKYYSELLEKSYIHKYLVIPNGIEISNDIISKKSFLKKALGIDENSIILIYCSRLSYNKSKLALLFLESFKKVIKKKKIFLL
ncbi:glycosyltransferase [Clostridium butyricum]|uniref:glycosyltransferase n=1 Tax=Clostridium butyricum TaxID=1492 RepID=UPI002ABE5466|nr:glycosyltransferase [Clostridium butyricum]